MRRKDTNLTDGIKVFFLIACGVCVVCSLILFSCASKTELKDPPIITSASYQHTLYNGESQPIEVKAARDDAPPFVVTYFASEADLENGVGGRTEAPSEVGVYYARVERPAGNGYRQGNAIKVEYHIQRALPPPQ
jgi:hypothetical protein